MKDIDFDELDRAVHSIIGGQSKKAPSVSAPTVAPPTIRQAAALTSGSGTAPTAKPVISGVSGSASRISSPASRRGGRFMDVVHPSSDMKPSSSSEPLLARPSERTVIAPLATDDSVVPEAGEPDEVADQTSTETPDTVTEVKTVEPETEQPSRVEGWPDPIDLAERQEQIDADARARASGVVTPSNPPSVSVIADGEAPGVADGDAAVVADASNTQTPFLPDTKVEKRPLGGFSADFPKQTDDTSDRTSGTSPHVAVLPPEYQPELVAIEAKEHAVELAVEDVEPARTNAHQLVTEPEGTHPAFDGAKRAAEAISDPDPDPSATVVAALTAGSIPSQYRSDAKVADHEQYAIFDTHTYHQPLLPAKTSRKKSALVWVLLAAGLLVVGAGLGVLLFMVGY